VIIVVFFENLYFTRYKVATQLRFGGG